MTNTSNSDPNFNISLASSNVTLTSYRQKPRKKRTKIANNETGSSSSSSRPKPVKEPDPDAPTIARKCTECGKQFSSQKALYGHMRCHPERHWRGINPPPNHIRGTNATATSSSTSLNWVSVTSEKDQVLASYLLLLANSGSTGPSGVEERFETGRCLKGSGSHQANTNLTEDPPPPQKVVDQDKSKGVKLVSGMTHRCNICFRVFSSGQALGGHMRCHWEKDQEENQVSPIDLNVPATISSDTSSGCSLDLTLGL